MLINFFKMNGLGNDFVIIEDYANELKLSKETIRFLSDRRRSIGFDQLMILRPSLLYPCFMEIYNADGSTAKACFNASRCVTGMLMDRYSLDYMEIDTINGPIKAFRLSDNVVSLIVGKAKFNTEDVPINVTDNMAVDFGIEGLPKGISLSVGNPHVIFFVDNLEKFDLTKIGPIVENHPFLPDRANVTIARLVEHDNIIMKTWERGAGETQACGSAATAAAAAAYKLGLSKSKIFNIYMPGGELNIEILPEYFMKVTGGYETSYTGTVDIKHPTEE